MGIFIKIRNRKDMKKIIISLSLLVGLGNLSAQVLSSNTPQGYGALATGGGNATPITVTDYATLKSNLTSAGAKVILVSGTITIPQGGVISAVISNKTLIGLPGAKLVNENQTGAGILNFKNGSTNIIVRNLIFVGPGAYDVNGPDNLTNQGATNVWVDHCEFQDGQDSNFDNVGLADNVTVSWCKFTYLKAPIPGGSGGSNDHRFSNLVGSSATDAPADGHYSITFHNNFWAEGCKERMPRARNAELHLLNNYYYTSVSGALAIGLGGGVNNSTVYVENSNFARVTNMFRSYTSTDGGSYAINYVNSSWNGNPVNTAAYNTGTVSAPSYSYSVMSLEEVATYVPDAGCGAGATLQVTTGGAITPGVCSFMATAGNNVPQNIKVFPIPVKDFLNIELPENASGKIQIVIYSADGRKVMSENVNASKHTTLNVQHLAKGTYFGTVNVSGKAHSIKFIK